MFFFSDFILCLFCLKSQIKKKLKMFNVKKDSLFEIKYNLKLKKSFDYKKIIKLKSSFCYLTLQK